MPRVVAAIYTEPDAARQHVLFEQLFALLRDEELIAMTQHLLTQEDLEELKQFPMLWPYRHAVLAGLAGAALLLLATEAIRGFGLERAMHAAVSEKFETARKDAGNSPSEQKKVEFNEGQELAKYGLERTGWFCLVLCLHALALLALAGRVGLERRGAKPPPRIAIQY